MSLAELQDSVNDDSTKSDSDSAFYTEETSATITLAESVTNYIYENGRTYHSYQAGKYVLPNDEEEQDRLDFFHHVFSMWLDGELHVSPLKNLHRVLDVGTGTGIWAMAMAERYPDVKVIGTDLSPIQPPYVYENLFFEVDDVELEWTYPSRYFDFIHLRCMSGCIQDWDFFFAEAFKCTRPGGFIELQDVSNDIYSAVGELPADSAIKQWYDLLVEASARMGRPMRICYRAKDLMEKAGYVDVVEDFRDWPYGTWMSGKKYKEIGRCTVPLVIDSLKTFSLGLLVRVMGWTPDEVEVICAKAAEDLRGCKEQKLFSKATFVYGRRPIEPGQGN